MAKESAELRKKNREQKARANHNKKIVPKIKKPRILILTEGEKTEPLYLERFCIFYGISYVKFGSDSLDKNKEKTGIVIEGKKVDSAPISIANFAEKQAEREEEKEPYWNEIYCVFDRDTHPTFDKAMLKISQLNKRHKNITIQAIVSDICFELWFLLHYCYTTKDFANADKLIEKLKQVVDNKGNKPFQNYEKNVESWFYTTKDLLVPAVHNAKRLKSDEETKPYTDIHTLILMLLEYAPTSSDEANKLKSIFGNTTKNNASKNDKSKPRKK